MVKLSSFYPVTIGTGSFVYSTGDQTISGVKNFASRPTFNGSGLAMTGEFITVGNLDTQNIVLRTGDQLISGVKTFTSRPTFNGSGLAITGEFITSVDLENFDLNVTGLVGVTTGQLFVSGFVEIVTGAFVKREDFLWTGAVPVFPDGVPPILNQVNNKFPGQIVYSTGDRNLYFYKSGSAVEWEKIVTNDVDDTVTFTNNFTLNNFNNGQVIYVNKATITTGSLNHTSFPNLINDGFNVTLIQIGNGFIEFPDTATYAFKNRIQARRTAGKYAIASILKIPNSNEFLLYGDVV